MKSYYKYEITKVSCEKLLTQNECLESIMSLDSELGELSWSLAGWTSFLKGRGKNMALYVIEKDNFPLPLGFCLYEINSSMGFAHLLKIATKSEFRNLGLGRMLLIKSETDLLSSHCLEKVILEVESKNKTAINFYKSNDFDIIHVQRKYYSNGSDATIMEKHC